MLKLKVTVVQAGLSNYSVAVALLPLLSTFHKVQ